MKIIKVKTNFFDMCKKYNLDKELMDNSSGRMHVLINNLEYKGSKYGFAVPIRSNISNQIDENQYFKLPNNKKTKCGHCHGIHYIKLFPITNGFIDKYNLDTDVDNINKLINEGCSEIVDKCQEYLKKCEQGKKHEMTPNIDGILEVLKNLEVSDMLEMTIRKTGNE